MLYVGTNDVTQSFYKESVLIKWACLFTEEPVFFTVPLKDVKCVEEEEVSLECEISKPKRKLTWKKDGKKLPVDARWDLVNLRVSSIDTHMLGKN